MARVTRHYDTEYKVQALKLAKDLGSAVNAAKELGIPVETLYGWSSAVRKGRLDIGEGAHTPGDAITLNKEMIQLRAQMKALEKENARLRKENAFLEEASAFFAASRLKSAKTSE